MTINDTLKAKIDELDLDRRLEELTVVTQKAFEEAKGVLKRLRAIGKGAKGQLGSLAYDNRLKVDEWLHKATDAFDAKTEGKYSDKVAKFSASIEDLVDKVAEKRTSAGAGSTDSGAPQDATSAFPSQTPTDSDAPKPS